MTREGRIPHRPVDVAGFMATLYQATSFEAAAERLLEMMAERTRAAANHLVLLRGMVHLRPGNGYRGLAVREFDVGDNGGTGGSGSHGERDRQGDVEDNGSGPGAMPSMTAWHWVEAESAPVLLDVHTGQARGADNALLHHEAGRRIDFRSRNHLLGRHAAEVMAFPLRHAGQRLSGFVSLELADQIDGTAWSGFASALQLMVDIAAPFIDGLPRAPRPALHGDPELPVIGATMRPYIEDLRLFANTDETLLLFGETGVGKSRLAKWCWKQSARANRPFVPVNLAAEPENLREGTLFGWKKGAFTGAITERRGLVPEASGGTLFIDEIDKLPLPGQAMLLSLLDDGHYRVIGDSELHHADIRFIVGTNANLEQAVEQGRLTRDLYYRIRVLPVAILPLRQRRDEITPWAEYMIKGLHAKSRRGGLAHLEAAAGARLEMESWPGNLRQLHSVVKRAYAFAGDGDTVSVTISHVERALAYELPQQKDALWRALERAAAAFVVEAQRRGELPLKHADVLTGFILKEATARLGEREAFTVLGRAKSLETSNHRSVLKRELSKVDALAKLLGHSRS
ncbi:MAG: sigma 54-interacting transcriptional regulator [Proteobacteria bacterium]|nr:sigma 54-interacting transcriptional regulator [Pseudomonadota bacterium]